MKNKKMKVRIVFYRKEYWPQWKGFFKWWAFYKRGLDGEQYRVSCLSQKEADDFLEGKSWEKIVVKEFEV